MTYKKITICALLITLVSAAVAPGTAQARERWGGDIRHFHERDIRVWRGGRWYHGPHDGRLGWWWIAAGSWYFFTRPLYPYPDPYVPTTVIVQPTVVQPVTPVQPLTPPPPPPAAAPAQAWYHCSNPEGYYPYVSSCNGGWTQVPATPAR